MPEQYLLTQMLWAVQMKRSTAGEGQRRLMEGLPPLCCELIRYAPQRRFCFVDWDVAWRYWSVVKQGWIHEECSGKLGFVAYRVVISTMVLGLKKAQEQLEAHPACSLDLLECHEGYYQLRFRPRPRYRPCCCFNARDECVCSAVSELVPTSSAHSRARSQLTNGDTRQSPRTKFNVAIRWSNEN
jgi:hypothetical protein